MTASTDMTEHNEDKASGTDGVKPPILSQNSLLPIGAAIAIMLGGISSAVWLNGTLLSIGYKLDGLVTRIDRLEGAVSDRWTRGDMSNWVEILHARNPTMAIPDVTK